MVKSIPGALFALVLAGTASAQDTLIWQQNVKGWHVSIDRTLGDSCFIITDFDNNTFLRFQVNSDRQNVEFIIAKASWNSLRNGQSYDLEVAFGDARPWAGVAKGYRWNDILPSLVLSVPFAQAQASQFMEAFTAKTQVSVSYEGQEIANLKLEGQGDAIEAMMECQAAMAEARQPTEAASDPFAPKPDPI